MFDITRLKDIRKKFNLTQHEFAKLAGVSQSLIAKIESGLLDPSYSNVVKLTNAINLLANEQDPDVGTIMSKTITTVESTTKVIDVIKLMKDRAISQIPITDQGKIIGLISETCLLEKELAKIKLLTARDVMTDAPPVISRKTKVSAAAALLRQFQLLVVQENDAYVGVVTKTDVLKLLVE